MTQPDSNSAVVVTRHELPAVETEHYYDGRWATCATLVSAHAKVHIMRFSIFESSDVEPDVRYEAQIDLIDWPDPCGVAGDLVNENPAFLEDLAEVSRAAAAMLREAATWPTY